MHMSHSLGIVYLPKLYHETETTQQKAMLVGNARWVICLLAKYLRFFLSLQILGRFSLFKVDVHALPTGLISRTNITEEKPRALLTIGKTEKRNLQVSLSLKPI